MGKARTLSCSKLSSTRLKGTDACRYLRSGISAEFGRAVIPILGEAISYLINCDR